ncbi:MAG TPA: CBS domain-containing protein [Pseudolabrys sp.]|nr:CBS domain-containing protein [Pseudolabrys sp.]
MNAKDIMTRTVVSVDPDTTVLQAARIMLAHHISGLPVVDKAGNLVGVLSEGDFLRRQETNTERRRSRWLEFLMGPGRIAGDYVHSHGNRVSEVMSTEVKTVDEDASLETIVELMEKHSIKRVPVMHGGKLTGIITRSNLMHAMVSLARVASPAAQSDAAIRERLLAEMQKQQWAPAATSNVLVHDGVVELWGMIVDERQRQALKIAAENIPGVTDVKDHLVWIEPTSGIVIEPPELPTQPRKPVVAAWPRTSH